MSKKIDRNHLSQWFRNCSCCCEWKRRTDRQISVITIIRSI